MGNKLDAPMRRRGESVSWCNRLVTSTINFLLSPKVNRWQLQAEYAVARCMVRKLPMLCFN